VYDLLLSQRYHDNSMDNDGQICASAVLIADAKVPKFWMYAQSYDFTTLWGIIILLVDK
jgi:hypothetical protein